MVKKLLQTCKAGHMWSIYADTQSWLVGVAWFYDEFQLHLGPIHLTVTPDYSQEFGA
jgi:hypothetical protein